MSRHKFKDLYVPMLKLPWPMIEKTIRKLSASDIFHFSLISPEHLQCIRSTTGHALSGAEIELEVTSPEEMKIVFTTVDANVTAFVISFKDIKKAAEYIMKNKNFNQEIDGFPMKMRLYKNKTTVYAPSGFESKIALINYCFENLQCQGISLRFESSKDQISVYQPIVNAFDQCQDLRIWCDSETQSNDDMEEFLSGIQVSRRFHLHQRSVQLLRLPPSVFSANKLIIFPRIVLTRETLLSINCEYAAFHNTDLTSEDLSAFVVKWFNSDGTQFKRLKVGTKIPFEPLDLSSIPGQYIEPMDNDKTKISRADGTFAVLVFPWPRIFDFRVSDEEVEFY